MQHTSLQAAIQPHVLEALPLTLIAHKSPPRLDDLQQQGLIAVIFRTSSRKKSIIFAESERDADSSRPSSRNPSKNRIAENYARLMCLSSTRAAWL